MPEPLIASGNTGSASTVPVSTPNTGASTGQTGSTGDAIVNSEAYKALEQRLGSQGRELGDYRQFFQNIAPLLEKLDQAPELVQAIIDGKVNKDLAQAVIENRVDIKDAAIVQAAHESVKEKLGTQGYNAASTADITKMIETQVGKVRKEFEEKAELQSFEDYTRNFIQNTPDFQTYSGAIDQWLEDHDNITDIEVAYYAVKGRMSETAASRAAEEAAVQRSKDLMANASGGGVRTNYAADGTPLVDQLIANRSNANLF